MLLKTLASSFGNGVWRVMPTFGIRNRHFATSKVPAKGSSMWGNDLAASEHAYIVTMQLEDMHYSNSV